MNRAVMRIWIFRALCVGGLLLLGLALAAALWGTLSALGDTAGAAVMRGMTLGILVCCAADLVVLVVLLALGEVAMPEEATQSPRPASTPSAETSAPDITR